MRFVVVIWANQFLDEHNSKKGKLTNPHGKVKPVSLLNAEYKIATKAIAKRLDAVLPLVINTDQTGYITRTVNLELII